ncbi:hypothetical protein GWI33_012358 [Rhynchophorus ferrugineus]|uniref:Uncharacterized protein n=1 Tax=Rhynchophorus ferrugineus TaxID=354439 RepID=A0A834IW86_RHYFE|nr:hypothetical protein GWI33_012358 [Rhynchophorus ferrugineus]
MAKMERAKHTHPSGWTWRAVAVVGGRSLEGFRTGEEWSGTREAPDGGYVRAVCLLMSVRDVVYWKL